MPRYIVIGDIHGQRAALEALLAQVPLTPDDIVVCVGDYVDRGPDTPGVLTRLIALQQAHPRCVFLRGNHDAMLLHFLDLIPHGDGAVYTLACNGGLATLAHYGCPATLLRACPEEHLPSLAVRHALRACLPREHLTFLMATTLRFITDEYVFVHAGINPARSLAAQREEDLLWIRAPFLTQQHGLPQTVVYGHTPTQDCDFDIRHEPAQRRIGVDTGAAYGGFLTALVLPDAQVVRVRCPAA
jgi:serine/threonine protein phosphatase 1